MQVANCSGKDNWFTKPTKIADMVLASDIIPDIDVHIESIDGVTTEYVSYDNQTDYLPFQVNLGDVRPTEGEICQLFSLFRKYLNVF